MMKKEDRKELEKYASILYEVRRRRETYPIDYFSPLPYQRGLCESTKRSLIVRGGNRSGKTYACSAFVVKYAIEHPKAKVICGTWSDLSTNVQQAGVYKFIPKDKTAADYSYSLKTGFHRNKIIFSNGSIIRFKTYDQGRESWQGVDADLIWLDEEYPEDLGNEVKARLIDRNGILLRSFTPVNGFTFLYDEIEVNLGKDDEIDHYVFPTDQNSFIDQQSRKRVFGNMSEEEERMRTFGSWENLGSGLVYYNFTSQNIVMKNPFANQEFDPRLPVEVGCDFNVNIMNWSIGQPYTDGDYIFDFIEMERSAHTEGMCRLLKTKFPQHRRFHFYIDHAGNQRSTSATRTDKAIIKANFPNAIVMDRKVRSLRDRTSSTNARLQDADGTSRLYINNQCVRLIKDLRTVTWEIQRSKKQGNLTHTSDGLSYMMYNKYPLDFQVIKAKYDSY